MSTKKHKTSARERERPRECERPCETVTLVRPFVVIVVVVAV